MNKSKIILFDDKKDCCNCNACKSICPKDAIDIYIDKYGFEYPKINIQRCISCGLCKKVCAFQNIKEKNKPIESYAALAKNKDLLFKSSSGGIFATIATMYLEEGSTVFGATFDDNINPIHTSITDTNLLYKLQGSKYVQSDIGETYKKTKELLIKGEKVLFSGTPCQVAGLKGYLMREYENLLTIDIVCHGVPSRKFFKDYLKLMEKKLNGKIKVFNFRDKSIGWGLNGSIIYEKNGIVKKKKIYASESSYYHYFLNSECYRESCYNCKYTCENRPADITIGDYWGIESEHPELLGKGKIKEERGISLLVANTKKGKQEINRCNKFYKFSSEFSKVRRKNSQLNTPSEKGAHYLQIMNEYRDNGYEAIDKLYSKNIGIKRYKNRVKIMVPTSIKRILKKYL